MALKRGHIDNTVSNYKKLKMYNDPEPDFINYISVPSLESMSIVSIATVLCKQSAIRDAIREHSIKYDPVEGGKCREIRGTCYYESFLKMEKKILNNLSILPLPNVLKVKVSNAVRPIELQLLNWIRYGRKDIEYIDSVCWNNEGTIDKIKTLKHLIDRDGGQNDENMFKLACNYCSEENVFSLWNKLPEETKKHYLCSKKIYKSYDNHLLAYWAHSISSDSSELIEKIRPNDNEHVYNFNGSINKNMFNLALFTKNILAVKYFWNKLTFVEINSNFKDWIQLTAKRITSSNKCYQEVCENSDIFYFLLSHTNTKTEQNKIYQKYYKVILHSLFFDWPWQRFLLPTINLLWEHIDAECYVDLLNCIVIHIDEDKTTEQLLSELWSDSPVNLKKSFIQKGHLYDKQDLFCRLLVVEKVGIIKAILKYADLEDQKQLLFLLGQNYKFLKVVQLDKLHLYDDLCIEVLSQSDIKCLKGNIVCEHFNRACFEWIDRNEWDKVNNFLNWAFSTQEVEHFKNEIMEKVEITHWLLYHTGNYESVNKFLDWCFGSEDEIHQFKIYFAESKPEIIKIGYEHWDLFEKFVDWCFNSDEEIQDFKSYIPQSHQIWEIVFSCIAFGYRFDFIENVIKWCFNSHEENLKEFKRTLALSETWKDLLQRFVSNYKCYDSDWSNWELIKKLFELVSPLDKDAIIHLKKRIALGIDFDDFRGDYKNRGIMVRKKDLFRLLDKDSFDIKDDYSSSDDEESSASGDEHDVSNVDDESLLILTEVLNNVESNLKVDKN